MYLTVVDNILRSSILSSSQTLGLVEPIFVLNILTITAPADKYRNIIFKVPVVYQISSWIPKYAAGNFQPDILVSGWKFEIV